LLGAGLLSAELLSAGCSALVVQRWLFSAGCSALVVQRWLFSAGCSALGSRAFDVLGFDVLGVYCSEEACTCNEAEGSPQSLWSQRD
jgi:hypothetical protein